MKRNASGMTLVEVMIAVAILAMVSVVVFGGFSQTMRNKELIQERSDRSHVIRVALERMVNELSMAYVSIHLNPSLDLQAMKTVFIGRRDGRAHRIDFTSFSHRRLYRDAHESDQNELSYYVTDHPDDYDRLVLVRREDSRVDDEPQEGGRTQILVEDVLDFELEYFDPTTQLWTETWDTVNVSAQPNRLPLQVKIALTVVDEDAERGRRTYMTRAQPMITWALNHAVYQN